MTSIAIPSGYITSLHVSLESAGGICLVTSEPNEHYISSAFYGGRLGIAAKPSQNWIVSCLPVDE